MVNRSDIGRVRSVNEDQTIMGLFNKHIAYAVVADGMGGHQAGDVASQLAIDAFYRILQQHTELSEWTVDDGKRVMKLALRQANQDIYKLSIQKENYYNMGTTMVAALLWDQTLIIGHVGDSRAYRISKHDIQQLTVDHSLVNVLVQSGQLSAEEAEHHPRRNVLTRAIGTDEEVEIDVQAMAWAKDATLLLCSDGLTTQVSDSTLQEVVAGEGTLDDKADKLIQLALEAGGEDNISLILLHSGDNETRREGL